LGGVLVAEDITQEQRLMNTLCRYMAREVAEQVMQNKDEAKLGGRRTEVTVLITDIRNFTSISEQMDPWDVVELLNTYFPRLINVIFRHQGMVDKFIGDSILTVFGIPMPREDDALRAVRAALEMRRELDAINRERARKGQITIEIGIGITSGTVISGNIGSERRMDYTVIGDPVNLAARLEGLTKEVRRRILVNERVQAAISKEIPCEPLGLFTLKGKREKVAVYAVKAPEQHS
jgi:adenylate cyclase